MLKKGLAVAVILLFIGMCVVPSTAVQELREKSSPISFDGNTIYVDDDNIEGPWYGTEEYPFNKIKDGIAAADAGDTVFVFNGEYREGYLTIEKSITLIGEDKENTIINGDGYDSVMKLKASGIVITGFTIKNSGNLLFTDWQIEMYYSKNIIISNNIIENGKKGGLRLADCSRCLIINNIIRNHDSSGIYISPYVNGRARNNIIFGNHIENNYNGLYFRGGPYGAYRNFVIKNNFIDNRHTDSTFNDAARNFWINNYWNQPGVKPVKIYGIVYILLDWGPYGYPKPFNVTRFDWFPAQEPYNI